MYQQVVDKVGVTGEAAILVVAAWILAVWGIKALRLFKGDGASRSSANDYENEKWSIHSSGGCMYCYTSPCQCGPGPKRESDIF